MPTQTPAKSSIGQPELRARVDPEDWSGVTAWKTRGADLREYLEGKEAR